MQRVSSCLFRLYSPTICTSQLCTMTDAKVVNYTRQHSIRLHPLQQKMREQTESKATMSMMMGAPEVHQICQNLIRSIGGKMCLDIASALAWALAIPSDGEVHTMDVSTQEYDKVGKAIIESDPSVNSKIHKHIRPANETLDQFLKNGMEGKFDFAFIDADKGNYPIYYEKCLKLLRPKGIIAVDNALAYGRLGFVDPNGGDSDLKAIHQLNVKIHSDDRVHCSFLVAGDGLMLAFKK